MQNLRNSFPEKSEKELLKIQKSFYRYFCDLFLETFKSLTISKSSMLQHCYFDEKSLSFLNRLADEHKSVILVLGHKGNWEWAGNTFSLVCSHQLFVIYHPLANPYFNTLMYKMRTRFGTKLIAMNDSFKEMVRNKEMLSATAFIADQTPQPKTAHWMQFLNQESPVFLGAEKIATKMKRIILFVSVQKEKRGYYKIVVNEKDIIDPNEYELEGEVTELHTRKLERDIIQQPETWLWTHRRWKHKRIVK